MIPELCHDLPVYATAQRLGTQDAWALCKQVSLLPRHRHTGSDYGFRGTWNAPAIRLEPTNETKTKDSAFLRIRPWWPVRELEHLILEENGAK